MKYFKTLPEQEYFFKNYFTLPKNEGLCCADCGTYITNVVQLIGRADKQVYNLGTVCCDKISKDRSVFLTPLSEQRKKIFMNQFKKHQQAVRDIEKVAELNGGATLRFADVDITYQQELRITLFIFCGNGFLSFTHLDNCERDFAGLKEITKGFKFDVDFEAEMDKAWNSDTKAEIKTLIANAYGNRKSYCDSLWQDWLKENYPELDASFRDISEKEKFDFFTKNNFKTNPMIF